ncbi:uncharacterized protein LOC143247191 isoform X3 [Tachypleus tridentatus]|uniref:uncharacterized protein LOC143247191 isoform X3 n=1 Tax=Tachypleus tridentatus TaxID=6853 RepID=UPI003FD60229
MQTTEKPFLHITFSTIGFSTSLRYREPDLPGYELFSPKHRQRFDVNSNYSNCLKAIRMNDCPIGILVEITSTDTDLSSPVFETSLTKEYPAK